MIFAVKQLTMSTFHVQICAFEVKYSRNDVDLVRFSSLYCHGTLSQQLRLGKFYIIEKNYCTKDLWTLF